MTFTTPEYAIFLSIVFLLYWFVLRNSIKGQNLLILVGSYIFYGWWNWKFLILIFISSLADFSIGQLLAKTDDKLKRKLLLYSSLAVNLGILFTFKYFNFFVDAFKELFHITDPGFLMIDLVLPVGISFYTLQTLSYTIDVYDRKMEPSKDFVSFFAYVSFFPQLVAGPIERATHLLPQFKIERKFTYEKASDGMRQILWGLFKKLIVADHCGVYVDEIFAAPDAYQGSTLFLALVVAAFQFYCDFSGYSDIAIGSGRLLGFNLSKNFDYPFFSRNISEFWQKWHITLIEWFRFYIVNKMKGFSKNKIMRNIFVVFFVTGLWHGANYTYVLWGVLHALTFIPLIYGKRKKHRHVVAKGKYLPSLVELFQMTKTFLIFLLIGVFFRIDTVYNGVLYLLEIFSLSFFSLPVWPDKYVGIGIGVLLVIEWLQREKEHGLELDTQKTPLLLRWGLYIFLILFTLTYAAPSKTFVYFQF
ncbi:MAG: MBOAT family O-acyltransferase [Bacteroidota bacterium]